MWKKCLMLSLLFTCIYTIKTMAFTYDQNNPLDTGYDDYLNNQNGAFTYDWFDNLGLGYYDFFTFTTRSSAMGNVYTEYANILYKNEDTNEIIFHNYYSGYDYAPIHKFYYVHNNTIIRINASRHINSTNYSYGHCVLFFEKNNDSTLKTVYFLDQVNGKGTNNYDNQTSRIIFTNNGNIYAGALRCSLLLYTFYSNFYRYL